MLYFYYVYYFYQRLAARSLYGYNRPRPGGGAGGRRWRWWKSPPLWYLQMSFYQRLAARSLYGYNRPRLGGGVGGWWRRWKKPPAHCGISKCLFITACRRTLTHNTPPPATSYQRSVVLLLKRSDCRAFVNWYLMGILNWINGKILIGIH